MESTQSTSVISFMYSKAKKYIKKSDVVLFVLTFTFFLIVHMYMFTNKFLNHDDTLGLLSDSAIALTSGRWFLKAASMISGYFSSPWLIGVVSAVYIGLGVVVVARLFRFKHTFSAALMAFAIVAFPSITATNVYMFTADGYHLSLTLSIIAALLIHKEKWWSMLLGIACLTLSMGCYQSNFAVTSALLIIVVGIDIVDKRWDDKWYGIIITALKYFGCLLAAMACYFIVLNTCLAITGKELVSYKGMDTMGQITVGEFITRSIAGYKGFFDFYRDIERPIFHAWFTEVCAIAAALSLITIAWAVVKRKLYRKPVMIGFLLLIMLVFPLAADLSYVMTSSVASVHLLMRFPSVLMLILPAIALDRININSNGSDKKIATSLISLLFAGLLAIQLVLCGEFMVITNRAYFTMDMSYRQTETFATKLFAKIEMTEGFTKQTPVALIGPARVDYNFKTTNIMGAATANDILNTYQEAKTALFMYHFGTVYVYAPQSTIDAIKETDEYKKMPVYPAEGSIKNVNGTIVVKFS